jgi:hypothetical protein
MTSDDKFRISVWTLAAIVVIALIAGGTYSGYHSRTVLRELVEKGANPLAVSCSLGVGQSEQGICTLVAANAK